MAAKKKQAGFLIVLMIASGVVWIIQNLPDENSGSKDSRSEDHQLSPNGSPPAKEGGFEVFTGCRLQSDDGNDGDSFRVKMSGGKVQHLRLYFVDAPESAFKRYRDGNTNGQRLKHQADYFSGLSQKEIVGVGHEAKAWVKSRLKQAGTFTVYTRGDEVYDSGRIYVLIKLQHGGTERWLHELLVEEGLARIYTMGTAMPDGTSRSVQTKRLKSLERAAKAAKKGGWGLARK